MFITKNPHSQSVFEFVPTSIANVVRQKWSMSYVYLQARKGESLSVLVDLNNSYIKTVDTVTP